MPYIILFSILNFSSPSFAEKTTAKSITVKIGGVEENYTGQIDRKVVRNLIGGLKKKFLECHKSEGQPALAGTLVMNFEISSDGRVAKYFTKSTTLNSPKLEGCIEAEIAEVQFPTLPQDAVAVVDFPISYQP